MKLIEKIDKMLIENLSKLSCKETGDTYCSCAKLFIKDFREELKKLKKKGEKEE